MKTVYVFDQGVLIAIEVITESDVVGLELAYAQQGYEIRYD